MAGQLPRIPSLLLIMGLMIPFTLSSSLSLGLLANDARPASWQDVGAFPSGAKSVDPMEIHQWIEKAKLAASDGSGMDLFGTAVAVNADTIVAGALRDFLGNGLLGSAYVFEKPAEGWVDMTETVKLTASDGAQGSAYVFSFERQLPTYLPLIAR